MGIWGSELLEASERLCRTCLGVNAEEHVYSLTLILHWWRDPPEPKNTQAEKCRKPQAEWEMIAVTLQSETQACE